MHKWIAFVVCTLLAQGAMASDRSGPKGPDWRQQVLHAEFLVLGKDRARADAARGLDAIQIEGGLVRVSLRMPTTLGTIAARLWLTPQCLLRHDRRLVALMPGTLANGAGYFEVDVPGFEGFDAVGVLARNGYCALAVDLPGSGGSGRPADAMDLRAADLAAAVAQVARPVSLLLGVWRWDVYAETGAPTPAALLLARRADVRSLVISSPFYLRFGPGSAPAFDPGLRAFAAVSPYFPIDAALIGPFFGASPAPLQSVALDAILGPAPHAVPTGPAFNEIAEVPFEVDPATGEFVLAFPIVDAAPARADALLLQGAPDFVGSEAGTAALAARYGEGGGGYAELVVIPGASHLMRFDTAYGDGPGSAVWAPVLAFLASH
jgi:alpha-beta hydrolase superfamily lysophospholipase